MSATEPEPEASKRHRWGLVAMAVIFAIPAVATFANERRGSSAVDAVEINDLPEGLEPCRADDLLIQTVQPTERSRRPAVFVRIVNRGEPCGLLGAPVVELHDADGSWFLPASAVVDDGVTNGPAWTGTFTSDVFAALSVARAAGASDVRVDALRILLPFDGGNLERAGFDVLLGDQVLITPIEADSTDG